MSPDSPDHRGAPLWSGRGEAAGSARSAEREWPLGEQSEWAGERRRHGETRGTHGFGGLVR